MVASFRALRRRGDREWVRTTGYPYYIWVTRGATAPPRYATRTNSMMKLAWAVALGILLVECDGEAAVRTAARLSQRKVGSCPTALYIIVVDVGSFLSFFLT